MPVYKTPLAWLDESIESILNQSYENFDFVIVNDCAPEEETRRLREWARKDSRIVLIEHEKNQGCAEALNTGLKACKTRLVARMDSDDYSFPNRLEKQVEFFNKNPNVDILGTGYRKYGTKKIIHPIQSNDACSYSTLMCCSIAHPTIMYKRETILKLGLYDREVIFAEDYDLWARAVKQGYVFANIDEALLDYRTKESKGHESYFSIQREWAKKISESLILDQAKRYGVEVYGFPRDYGTFVGAINLMCIIDSFYMIMFKEKTDELRDVRKRNLRNAYKTFSGSPLSKVLLKVLYKMRLYKILNGIINCR